MGDVENNSLIPANPNDSESAEEILSKILEFQRQELEIRREENEFRKEENDIRKSEIDLKRDDQDNQYRFSTDSLHMNHDYLSKSRESKERITNKFIYFGSILCIIFFAFVGILIYTNHDAQIIPLLEKIITLLVTFLGGGGLGGWYGYKKGTKEQNNSY